LSDARRQGQTESGLRRHAVDEKIENVLSLLDALPPCPYFTLHPGSSEKGTPPGFASWVADPRPDCTQALASTRKTTPSQHRPPTAGTSVPD
jgi:hypothetical protein